MILTTAKVEDFDRFLKSFSIAGEKRRQHGSKGALVFRDPNQDDQVWVVFDWDEKGLQNFESDPAVLPIVSEAGLKTRPQTATPSGQYSA
ncbi:MAG: hypothetical protein WBA18_11565 [Terracidiphilus sp.]